MTTLDEYVEAFEAARQHGQDVSLSNYLPPDHDPLFRPVLRELVRIDLEFGWESNRPRELDDYRREYPSLFADPDSVQEIAFEEYRLRRQAGQRPDPQDYARRYGVRVDGWPADTDEASLRLEEAARSFQAFRLAGGELSDTWKPPAKAHPAVEGLFREMELSRADEVARALTRLPEAGTEFGGFFLLAELGRGAFGRVFLSRQTTLADRPVALKVSADSRAEADTLARLQHTHIVPIHSVHSHGPLQAVCMPYRGPVTLGHVVRRIMAEGAPADDRAYRATLKEAARKDEAPRPETFGEALPEGSHVRTTLWIGACLAQALHHAHVRGVLHRDLKPSNVLLADDGTPMLLDFNVAQDDRAGPCEATVGGTLPYMAPEQLRAFRDNKEERLDGRADVYSLGLVLYELLAGRFPFPAVRVDDPALLADRLLKERLKPVPCPRTLNRYLSPSAASIVRHCLAPDPAKRYPSADALREDIERQLNDQPLKYAPEPSIRERWAKWWRRSPGLRRGMAAAAVGMVLLAGVAGWTYAGSLREAERSRQLRERFTRHLRHAQFLLATRPETDQQREEGEREAQLALRAHEQLRPTLPKTRERIDREAGVLHLLLAASCLDSPNRLEQALEWNTRAQPLLDADSAVGWEQRAEILDRMGRTPDANEARARMRAAGSPPGDRLLRARALVKSARHRDALALLNEQVRESPDDFWALFLSGLACEGLRRADRALTAYTACIALDPHAHGAYVNRGLLYFRYRRFAEAEADLTRALEEYPGRAETYLDRALVRLRTEDVKGAEADLSDALDGGISMTRVYFLRSQVRRLAGDESGAKADLETGLRLTPTDEASWIARGFHRLKLDPKGASADFDEALKLNPMSRAGLMGKASVLAEYSKDQEASRKVLLKVLRLYPDHPPALAGLAVVLARLGQRDAAINRIEAALRCDPSGEIRYQAACVHALTGEVPTALRYLKAAVADRYGLEFLDKDRDLMALRKRDEFTELVRAAKALRGG